MKIVTFKRRSILRLGFGKEDITFDIGHTLEYIKSSKSYYPFYEIYNYDALFLDNNKQIKIKMTRIYESSTFRLDGFRLYHTKDINLNRFRWDDIFEEKCPINIT